LFSFNGKLGSVDWIFKMLENSEPSPIISASGIRGVVNENFLPSFVQRMGRRFGSYVGGGSVALATDTRTSSGIFVSSVISGLLQSGCTVFDLGYSSTPSVFKEVLARGLDGGIMVTSSHNPPEWNGLKFVVKGGRGIYEEELSTILSLEVKPSTQFGRVFKKRALYYDSLLARAGKDTAKNVKVALDLAGGVGCFFIPTILRYQGCVIHSIHDSPGLFPRIIDPTSDPLSLLSRIVVARKCNVGFAYDCDADRLVIVDDRGRKLSGDATLLICLRYFLENTRNRSVAVSTDTSMAAEDLVREFNGKLFYAKVGETNVLKKILENGCGAGGEGSSGGYIEPSFAKCRDGVYASTIIAKMLRNEEGSLSDILSDIPTYFQARTRLEIQRDIAQKIVKQLSETEGQVELIDGVKIKKSERSWVLLRPSNTEHVLRISAEAKTQEHANRLVKEYSEKALEFARSEEMDSKLESS
jgi:phosphomannomutase